VGQGVEGGKVADFVRLKNSPGGIVDEDARKGYGILWIIREYGPFDLVLIMAGLNDLPARTLGGNLVQLHQACHRQGVATIAVGMPPTVVDVARKYLAFSTVKLSVNEQFKRFATATTEELSNCLYEEDDNGRGDVLTIEEAAETAIRGSEYECVNFMIRYQLEKQDVQVWEVVHTAVLIRSEPSMHGLKIGVVKRGQVIKGREYFGWVQLCHDTQEALGLKLGDSREAFILTDGRQAGLGKLLDQMDNDAIFCEPSGEAAYSNQALGAEKRCELFVDTFDLLPMTREELREKDRVHLTPLGSNVLGRGVALKLLPVLQKLRDSRHDSSQGCS